MSIKPPPIVPLALTPKEAGALISILSVEQLESWAEEGLSSRQIAELASIRFKLEQSTEPVDA